MPETKTADQGRAMLGLLRFLLKGPCTVSRLAEGDTLVLTPADGAARTVARSLLDTACQRGLVECRNRVATCLPAGRASVKRALADVGEVAFLGQHARLGSTPARSGKVDVRLTVNLDESPLSSLSRLKDRTGQPFLPEEAVSAGNRLHADFTRSQLQPRITQSFSPRVDGGQTNGQGADLVDTAIAARARLNAAIAAMGPELSGVALDICCFYKGLERVEQERGWPVRSAKLMLRTALLALSRHYHPQPATPAAPPLRHWGEDGYRPDL